MRFGNEDLPFNTDNKSNLGFIGNEKVTGGLGLALHADQVLFLLAVLLNIGFGALENFLALSAVLLHLRLLMGNARSSPFFNGFAFLQDRLGDNNGGVPKK